MQNSHSLICDMRTEINVRSASDINTFFLKSFQEKKFIANIKAGTLPHALVGLSSNPNLFF